MKVVLRNPRREVEVAGGRRVKDVLVELDDHPRVRARDPRRRAHHHRSGRPRRRRHRAAARHVGWPAMKCRKCGERATIELRRHNTAFCSTDFQEFFKRQVREAIRKHRMFTPRRAGAGGGVGRQGLARAVGRADRRRLPHDRPLPGSRHLRLLGRVEGEVRGVRGGARRAAPHRRPSPRRSARRCPIIKQVTRRPPCSGCGLSKRYLMNRVALEHRFPVVATGHNLDDEAATLFGSVMHWQTDALAAPVAGARVHAPEARAAREAALPPLRAGDGGVRVRPQDRLHRRGVPVREGRHLDRAQGDPQPDGRGVARREAQLPLRLPREGAAPPSSAPRASSSRSARGAGR